MDESHRNNVQQKKSDTKWSILYDSIYTKFKNKQNYFIVIGMRIGTTFQEKSGEIMSSVLNVLNPHLGGGGYTDVFSL